MPCRERQHGVLALCRPLIQLGIDAFPGLALQGAQSQARCACLIKGEGPSCQLAWDTWCSGHISKDADPWLGANAACKATCSARVASGVRFRVPGYARPTSDVRYLVGSGYGLGLGEGEGLGDGGGPGAVASTSTVKTSVAFGGMITAPLCGSV